MVALHCFSGLRAEEIVALHWEAIEWRVVDDVEELRVWVERGTRMLHLPVPGPAVEAMAAYVAVVQSQTGKCADAVFRCGVLSPHPLSYRAARNLVVGACQRAGYGPVASVELRAAFAAWLRYRGLSDHEVAAVLGVARVRSVDRLLTRHVALSAQRAVRERFG